MMQVAVDHQSTSPASTSSAAGTSLSSEATNAAAAAAVTASAAGSEPQPVAAGFVLCATYQLQGSHGSWKPGFFP